MTSNSNLWRALADASSGIAPLAEDDRAEYGGGGYDYISAPDPLLRGRKCLAGYCRTQSIWMMVR